MLMISIKNISKSYLQRGLVLDQLSMEVNEGEAIAVMGPSGSGKTTLLNIIALLDKPDSGDIRFRDQPISNFSDNQAAAYRNLNIGFVFQEHLLMPHLNVYSNVLLPLLPANYSKEQKAEREKHISLLMEKAGIADLKEKYPFQISGGEAQRVALVRALANNPSVLIGDEPTGSLDSKNAEIMGNLILDMNKEFGTTIIIATHSEGLAQKMLKTYKLCDGKLVG
jgi:ABC-type lipoprotein export system ATPase subunit